MAGTAGHPPHIGRIAKLHLAFWCEGRKRIHAVKSAIHAIGVRQYAVFYDIKSESRRRKFERNECYAVSAYSVRG